jgi:hypothetical protein
MFRNGAATAHSYVAPSVPLVAGLVLDVDMTRSGLPEVSDGRLLLG